MRSNIKYLLFLSIFFILSCKKDYTAPVSSVLDMSGRWWINFVIDMDGDGIMTDADLLYFSYADFGEPLVVTSNVASNAPDTLLIDDHGWWPFKGKFPIDYASKTVSAVSGTANLEADGESVTVREGKILPGAGTTLSGAAIDSIFLALEFSDDPGNVYFYTGVKYTGQLEDNYH
jgi:Lipid-binding putative hydrolase